MTLYGESEQQFRPRPHRAHLAIFAVASTVLAAWLAALVSNLVMQVATAVRLTGRTGIPIALFPAGPQTLPGMTAVADPVRMAVAPLLLLALAVLLLTVWPASTTLASRLSVTYAARTFALAALTGSLATSPIDWLSGDLSAAGLWKPVVAISCGIVLWRSETSLMKILSSGFQLQSPTRRTLLWSVASLPQWLAWLALAALQSYVPGMTAGLLALVATLAASAGMKQFTAWEKLDRPRMIEDTLLAAIAALLVAGAGYATFGAPLLSLQRHAVILGTSPIAERLPLTDIRVTSSEPPQATIQTPGSQPATTTAEPGATDEPVIDIRWSEPKPDANQAKPP